MALTPRENAMAIFYGEQPDYYGDIMSTLQLVGPPKAMSEMVPHDGLWHKDVWGVTKCWPLDAPGPQPMITEETKVIKDICNWREEAIFPEIHGLDWSDSIAQAKAIDSKQYFTSTLLPGGLFERSHFNMGFEDALCNFLEEPEAMKDWLRAVCDWKLECIDEWAAHIKLDVMFYHDDWGNKKSLFLPPDVWREFIKPLQQEISDRLHDHGMIYIHHSDCVCDLIGQDMSDIGVDIWQGVIPQNDIIKLQKETTPQLRMCGGFDGPALDHPGVTEEEIRAEVRRSFDDYLPQGGFYPSNPFGLIINNMDAFKIAMDEHISYGKIYAQEHPVG